MNPVSKALLGVLVAIMAIMGFGSSPAQAATRHHGMRRTHHLRRHHRRHRRVVRVHRVRRHRRHHRVHRLRRHH